MRTDLLRILLADQDDTNAFLFQCGVNRLARPCAFKRISSEAHLADMLASFQPDIVIAAGKFATPLGLGQMKLVTNSNPIICAVHTVEEAEASMAAGATDCVLVSQVDELHTCIERRIEGQNAAPYFTRLSKGGALNEKASPSKLDLKLEEFDRRMGALLKRLGTETNLKFRKLVRVSRIVWHKTQRETNRYYRALKVQWLLWKQKRLVRSTMPSEARTDEAGSFGLHSVSSRHDQLPSLETLDLNAPRDLKSQMIRIVSPSPRTESARSIPGSTPVPTNGSDTETLRTLELSFKKLFHSSLDAVLLLDETGSFLHANGPACSLLSLPAVELLGKTLFDFVPAVERSQAAAIWEALLIEGQQKGELRLQTAGGEMRDVYISARSNLWFGVHLLVIRDQTELKALRQANPKSAQAA